MLMTMLVAIVCGFSIQLFVFYKLLKFLEAREYEISKEYRDTVLELDKIEIYVSSLENKLYRAKKDLAKKNI